MYPQGCMYLRLGNTGTLSCYKFNNKEISILFMLRRKYQLYEVFVLCLYHLADVLLKIKQYTDASSTLDEAQNYTSKVDFNLRLDIANLQAKVVIRKPPDTDRPSCPVCSLLSACHSFVSKLNQRTHAIPRLFTKMEFFQLSLSTCQVEVISNGVYFFSYVVTILCIY